MWPKSVPLYPGRGLINVINWVTCTVLVLATVGIGMGFQPSGPMSSSAPAGDRSWSKHWAYKQQRSRAHRRMKNTMYASTPDRAAAMCPVLSDGPEHEEQKGTVTFSPTI